MKPFNLQDALAGKPVVTRSGRKLLGIVAIPFSANKYKAVAQIDGMHTPTFATEDGCYLGVGVNDANDLFMASEKKTGWITIYPEKHAAAARIFNTKEEALAYAARIWGALHGRVPAKIEWEE